MRLWDVAQRREIAVLQHPDFVADAAFSPDGQLLAVAEGGTVEGTTIRLWDVAQRQTVAVLQGHTSWVISVAFSPDGQLLASSSNDGTVRLWGALPTAVEAPSFVEASSALPQRTVLLPAYPNPGNPNTWIPYDLSQDAEVSIRISTVTGQVVRILTLGAKPAGRYLNRERAAYWDGRTAEGQAVASGVYYVTLCAGSTLMTRSLVVLK